MSEHIEDGGPAFPVVNQRDENNGDVATWASEGISARDYFAAHVQIDVENMSIKHAELLIGMRCPDYASHPEENMLFWIDAECKHRYLKADAMLKARKS
jgi:hypothetical protein